MSRWTISKEFAFSASHVLDGLPEGHQCGRLHGHNYVLVVELSGRRLDKTGFVLDYGELAPVKRWIDGALDHRHLNDTLPMLSNPTAEEMARYIGELIPALVPVPDGVDVAVAVSETPKTWAKWWSR
jgi:6-pyruvoyltetrahydropterin/6-carboxytetrahydropterin synthase